MPVGELADLYINKQLSQSAIASRLGVSQQSVSAALKASGIASRSSRKLQLSKGQLENLYLDKKLSQLEIAELHGVAPHAVHRLLKKFRIASRSNAESQLERNVKTGRVLTEEQEQLLYGSLLGDACLSRSLVKSRNSNLLYEHYAFQVYHTAKHLPYVQHKHTLLGRSFTYDKATKIGTRVSGKGSIMRGFTFSHTPTLRKIAAVVLGSHKQKYVTTNWLDRLNWIGIAYWYQDDGSLSLGNGSRYGSIKLHTEGFTPAEQRTMQTWWRKKGFDFKISRSSNATRKNSNNRNEKLLILHKTKQVYAFLSAVRPHIQKCMLYKIRTWTPTGVFRVRVKK